MKRCTEIKNKKYRKIRQYNGGRTIIRSKYSSSIRHGSIALIEILSIFLFTFFLTFTSIALPLTIDVDITEKTRDRTQFLKLNHDLSFEQASKDEGIENTITLTYSFPEPVIEKHGSYDIPLISKLRNDDRPGMPTVPARDVKILIPQGEAVRDIIITAEHEVSLKGSYLIKPGGWPMTFSSMGEPLPHEGLDLAVYNSKDMYPGVLCSQPNVQGLRGFQVLSMKLYPLHYIPVEGTVFYYEDILVTVNTFNTNEITPLYRGLIKDMALLDGLVDNPLALDNFELNTQKGDSGDISTSSLTDPSESYNYVIITNNALAPSFQNLADFKNESGISTNIVVKEDITSDPDYDGVDTQEEIRNFIIDAYTNWEIDYVLLGGDDQIIPHRGCYGNVSISPSEWEEDFDIPTDLYYGGLDGNWDSDNDGIFGEEPVANGGTGTNGEEADLLAEVFVGRAPVNTPAEVNNFVDKIIDFETHPKPKHVTLHGEEDENSNRLDYIKNGEGGLYVLGVEYYIPSGYNITRLYEAKGDEISTVIWNYEIANDTLIVNHGGHGSTNGYDIKNGLWYPKAEAAGVTNSFYPIHLSIACYSGAFDDGDCIAEKYITNTNGGMVACILNSRYGWFLHGDVTRYSGELDNEFYNQLFNGNYINIGQTLQEAKEQFAIDALTPSMWDDDNVYRWVIYEWNLLGDPTLDILGNDKIPPEADAGQNDTINEDTSYEFDGSGSSDNVEIIYYNWTFDDGFYNYGSDPTPSHVYTLPGIYTVNLKVTDPAGNWDTDTVRITVEDVTPPAVDAGPDITIDEDSLHTFDASSSYDPEGGNIVWYNWSFGDNSYQNGSNPMPSHTYEIPSEYIVTIVITDDASNWNSTIIVVTVRDKTPPVIDAGSDASIEEDSLHTFDATASYDPEGGSIAWYNWSFDDGGYQNGTDPSPTHIFTIPGVYTVSLKITDEASNSNTTFITMTVNDVTSPVVDIGPDISIDENGPYMFDALSSHDPEGGNIIWYNWSFGDGLYQNGSNPTPIHSYNLPAQYVVTLNITDEAGNSNSTSITVTVRDITSPVVDAGSDGFINEDTLYVFDATGSYDPEGGNIVWYNWSFGDDSYNNGSEPSPDHTYTIPGIYIVYLTITDEADNRNNTSITIYVKDLTEPVIDVGYDDTIDEDTPYTFNATGSYDPEGGTIVWYNWSFGDDSYLNSSNPSPIHTFAIPGIYLITLNITDAGGNKNHTTIIVTVKDKTQPVADIALIITINEDTPYTFNASDSYDPEGGAVIWYNWSFGDGKFLNGSNSTPIHMYPLPDIYYVILNLTDASGNLNSTTILLIVNDVPPPVAEVGPNEITIQEDIPYTFNATASYALEGGTIVWYNWSFGDDSFQFGGNSTPIHIYTLPGNYSVTLNLTDEHGNLNTTTINVTVIDITPPVAEAEADFTIDEDTPHTFDATNSYDPEVGAIIWYNWSFDDGSYLNGSDATPTHSYKQPGTYKVTLLVTDQAGNSHNVTINVTVRDKTRPDVYIGEDRIIDEDKIYTFDGSKSIDNVGIISYKWEFGDGSFNYGTNATVEHNYTTPGIYLLNLTVVDAVENENLTTIQIIVNDITKPVPVLIGDDQVNEYASCAFNAGDSYDNVDIVYYSWNFDDGSDLNGTDATVYHVYRNPGTYTVTLTIGDEAGNCDTTTMIVRVADITSPIANVGPDASIEVSKAFTFDGSGSTDNVDIIWFNWSFGDETYNNGSNPSPSHIYEDPGTYTVTLLVTDGEGNTAEDTMTIRVYLDSDGDGIENSADFDDDNDGVSDSEDYYPLDSSKWKEPSTSDSSGLDWMWIILPILLVVAVLVLLLLYNRGRGRCPNCKKGASSKDNKCKNCGYIFNSENSGQDFEVVEPEVMIEMSNETAFQPISGEEDHHEFVIIE